MNLKAEDYLIFVNQGLNSLIPGKISSLFKDTPNFDSTLFLEVSDGCTGFVRALILANTIILSKTALRVHIVCGEKYSAYYMDSDTSVSPIFSDAISLTTIVPGTTHTLVASSVNNFFEKSDAISTYTDSSARLQLKMDGSIVLSWATNSVPTNLDALFLKSSITKTDIDTWLFHQGSKIMIEMLADRLEIDNDGLFVAGQIGNATSSSIPIALSKVLLEKDLSQSQSRNVVMVGFGVGLSIVSILVRINL